jgi:CRP-like cAMP-binding protein
MKLPPMFDMTLLAPFSSSKDSGLPESLRIRLKSFGLLEDVGESALRRLLAEADWFGLPGGTQLPRDGENDRAVFLVVTGSLGVFVEEDQGSRRLVATIPAGETVGEMSLLTGEPRSATVRAVEGALVYEIGRRQYEPILLARPELVDALERAMESRLSTQDAMLVRYDADRARAGFARRIRRLLASA